jgi:hypothetical protein
MAGKGVALRNKSRAANGGGKVEGEKEFGSEGGARRPLFILDEAASVGRPYHVVRIGKERANPRAGGALLAT